MTGAELLASGVSRYRLTRLVAEGSLHRPRLGWYSCLSPQHPRFRAARLGGRLTGASALHDMGAWMLHEPSRLEVAVQRGASRLRPEAGVVVHWESVRDDGGPAVVGLREALVRVVLDHDLEVSVPSLDWALHTGRVDRFRFEQVLLALPMSARCVRDWVDARSESVLESVARVRLRRRGWNVASQVRVGDLGAIDLVVEDRVAVELDGREHHRDRFEADRRKDLQITHEGRHCIRASYRMVVDDWPHVEAAIEAALRARGVAQDSVDLPREPSGRLHAHGSARVFD